MNISRPHGAQQQTRRGCGRMMAQTGARSFYKPWLAYYVSSVTSLSIIVIILLNVRSFQHLNAVVEGLLPRSALTRETFRGVWITSLWRCCILSLFAATSPRRAASCILSCVT